MAYKFQVGQATLSGSTKFEQVLDAAGGIKMSGVDAAVAAPNSDSIVFLDSDGLMKTDSMVEYAALIAGDGLAAASRVLAVGVDDSTVELNSDALRVKAAGINVSHLNSAVAGVGISGGGGSALALDFSELVDEAIASGDRLAFRDATDDGMHAETVDDLATLFAGTGLAAASAVLSVDLNELGAAAVNVGADSIAIIDADDSNGSKKESISDLMTAVAGNGLAAASGVLSMDASELAQAAIAHGDFIVIEDVTDNSTKKEAVADLATLFAGDGLVAASSVLSVGVDDSTIELNSDALRLKDDGVTGAKLAPAVAGLGLAQDGSGNLDVQVSGAVKIASDKLGISGSIAGDGLAFAGGADSIAAIRLSIPGMAQSMTGDVADTDEFAISDGGTMKKVDFSVVRDAVFADVSGDATVAAGGALTIGAGAVEGSMLNTNAADTSTIEVSSNTLSVLKVPNAITVDNATLQLNSGTTYDGGAARTISIKDGGVDADALNASVAGLGLAGGGGSALAVDLNELAGAAIADGDFLAFVDATDNTTKKEAVADLATLFAGNGLVAASSVLAVNTGKGLEIESDVVKVKVAGNGGITRQAGGSSDSLGLNANGLTEAVVNVAADSFAFVDADDTFTKKDTIADLAAGMAGTGLTATSGQLNARLDTASKADGDTLAVGMNFMADMGSDGEDTLNLPASAGLSAGDVIHVKAPSDCSSARSVKILKNGSQTIDGLTQVIIESPFGAVSMVYIGSDQFRLI